MIGHIYSSVIPYYDSLRRQNSYKKRPVLIISGPRNNDYTVLPVSTVSKKQNLDLEYDVEIDPSIYPNTNLDKISYVRTHKQTTVHMASLTSQICDLKGEYEKLYRDILIHLEAFNKKLIDEAGK